MLGLIRQIFTLVVVAAVVLFALAFVGPTLPDGNPLRGLGEGIRDMAGGFGGGYQPVVP